MPIPVPGLIIRLTSYLFSSTVKKFYPREKLAEMIKVEFSKEPSAIKINCFELPDISAWLVFTNTSPFHVTLFELEAELYMPDRVANLVKICNLELAPSVEERLFIQTDLTEKQVEYIEKHKSIQDPFLNINAMLNCRLSSFDINDREIPATNIEFISC